MGLSQKKTHTVKSVNTVWCDHERACAQINIQGSPRNLALLGPYHGLVPDSAVSGPHLHTQAVRCILASWLMHTGWLTSRIWID